MGVCLELYQQVIERLNEFPIGDLPAAEQRHILSLAKQIEEGVGREVARSSFMGYVKQMWPAFIEGRHHRVIADAFDRIISGDLKRLIITLPPRYTKSMFASYLLPSFYFGHFPDRKIIQASHTAELAVDFGRDVRNLVDTKDYKDVFPNTVLRADAKAAGRWNTGAGGRYFAIGVGGKIAGKGADLLIIDDPHSEQDLMSGDPKVFDRVYEWYTKGPRQRLQPNAAIVIVTTRWHVRDLVGRITKNMTQRKGMDQWEIIEFPALFETGDEANPFRPLWPEYWSLELMLATRDEIPASEWAAQFQQDPTSEEGALIKREWWKIWERPEPPNCEFVIQSWDTAFLKTQRADYSACTTWGVFYLPDDNGQQQANIILLDAFKERLEFPALKKKAFEMWKQRQPDAFIVEGKASGMPLIFELRKMGIPVAEYSPHRGSIANPNDKVSRVNGISDLFASGIVWCPESRYSEMVIEEFAAFPNGDHDDFVDSGTQALYRFREGGFLRLNSDVVDEPTYRQRFEPY